MRRPPNSWTLTALGALLACLFAAPAANAAIPPPYTGGERPSIVVIQTDDQTLDSVYETFSAFPGAPATRAMPNTLDLIGKRGMTFNRYYVPYPLCCPSRVSLLTGRYSHNNNVRGNNPPNGGYTGFSFRGAATNNIATWLQGAGYRTVHVGKVMNGYGQEPFSNSTEVCRSAASAAGKRASTTSATTSAARLRRSTGCPASTSPTS